MAWFAFQRSMRGEPTPATFDERPDPTRAYARDVIPETIREIPFEMEDQPLSELAKWASPPKP